MNDAWKTGYNRNLTVSYLDVDGRYGSKPYVEQKPNPTKFTNKREGLLGGNVDSQMFPVKEK